jgi:hypothetical protein
VLLRNIAGLGVTKRPQFVCLDALTRQVADRAVLILARGLSEIAQELENGHLGRARHAAGGVDRGALDEAADDLSALLGAQAVHTGQNA